MPRRTTTDSLETFIREQDATVLADLLVELIATEDAVKRRVERLKVAARPDKLAAAFRKTLAGWRRGSRFLHTREANAFGIELETWLGQVERELLPTDPAAALALSEDFIESDDAFFRRADDSDGAIGDAVRAACRLWLKAAPRVEAPRDTWPARLARLAGDDEYGAREELLRRADALLDEAQLRGLVHESMAQLKDALASARAAGRSDTGIYRLGGTLHLLSEALHDPDVHVDATLLSSPQPNPVQKEHFAREYLREGRPGDALRWLDGQWGHHEASRLGLRAEALRLLGRNAESATQLGDLFRQRPAAYSLGQWLEALPPGEQAAALDEARGLARSNPDPVRSAELLIEIGDDAAAQARLVEDAARVDGERYEELVPLAEALESRQCWDGTTVAYRALLDAILERARSLAYGHGARYLGRLRRIAAEHALSLPTTHDAYEAALHQRHARKSSFWARAESSGKSPAAR